MADAPKPVPKTDDQKAGDYRADWDKMTNPDKGPVPSKPIVKKASGGSIRGGGCETRGKTKGRMV